MFFPDDTLELDLFDVVKNGADVRKVVQRTRIDGLDVLPSTLAVARLDHELISMHRREDKVLEAIAPLLDDYDVMVLDLPPSLNAVVIANGVVFALSTGENAVQKGGEARRLQNTRPAVLKALDAWTGKELYNAGAAMTSWVHFGGLAVSNGKVFAVDHDSNVYCFGLAGK